MVTIEDAKKILSKNDKGYKDENYSDEKLELILKFMRSDAKIVVQFHEQLKNSDPKIGDKIAESKNK